MTINGWDIAEAGAVQWNVTPGYHNISNDSEWTRGSPVPVMFKNQIGFKPLKVTVLVKADRDRQAILRQCGEILSHLQEPVDLVLDSFEHKFYGILTKHSLEENPLNIPWLQYNRASKLTLEFNGYEYGEEITATVSGTDVITVTNTGNIETPAVIEVTPQIAIASLTMSGICRDPYTGSDLIVAASDLSKGEKLILDGETGLFTQGGVLKDIDIWGIPTLAPGNNTITADNIWVDIAVRFRPRFM